MTVILLQYINCCQTRPFDREGLAGNLEDDVLDAEAVMFRLARHAFRRAAKPSAFANSDERRTVLRLGQTPFSAIRRTRSHHPRCRKHQSGCSIVIWATTAATVIW